MAKQKSVKKTAKHPNLASAVIAVMEEVKGMEKNSKVGTGNHAYDGTRDMDVKEVFNEALANNGLCVLPVAMKATSEINRWQEENTFGKKTVIKQKKEVFTEVKTKYKLIHADSGESEIIVGLGHGVDTQDKGAGKATTYALKNALLYSFITPVGKIDDTDNTHSEDIEKNNAEAKALEEKINKAVKEIEGANTMEEYQTACKNAKDLKKYKAIVVSAREKKIELEKAQAPKNKNQADRDKEKKKAEQDVKKLNKILDKINEQTDMEGLKAIWDKLGDAHKKSANVKKAFNEKKSELEQKSEK